MTSLLLATTILMTTQAAFVKEDLSYFTPTEVETIERKCRARGWETILKYSSNDRVYRIFCEDEETLG